MALRRCAPRPAPSTQRPTARRAPRRRRRAGRDGHLAGTGRAPDGHPPVAGIKHRKNEIFLDVVERLNLLVAANGTLLRSEILGSLKMRSYLSGMPELKLGLNDKLLFEATGRRFLSLPRPAASGWGGREGRVEGRVGGDGAEPQQPASVWKPVQWRPGVCVCGGVGRQGQTQLDGCTLPPLPQPTRPSRNPPAAATSRAGGRGVSKGKAVEMEDIKFHQCVRLARFENDRTISFIPPDGEFELMSYRLSTQARAPACLQPAPPQPAPPQPAPGQLQATATRPCQP